MKEQFTLVVFTENHVGLLTRVTNIITQRRVNIESITVSESEVSGVHRFTVVIVETPERARLIATQIEKQVEVIRVAFYRDEEVVFQEVALYKLPLDYSVENYKLEELIRNKNARILSIENGGMIVEKTGHKEETEELLELLKPFGLYEFVRSGRVAISKKAKPIVKYLEEFEKIGLTNQI